MADIKPFQLDNCRLPGGSGLRVSPLCLGPMTLGASRGWACDAGLRQALSNTTTIVKHLP